MSAYRPEFIAALRLFARVSEAMADAGHERPVLVGGAAAEFYTLSALTTGDFDLCTPCQAEFETLLRQHGFVRPSGARTMIKGWVHPDLQLGFEVVARVPMDGSVDQNHIKLVRAVGTNDRFRVISVEDLIADRMGQFASGTARDRLDQAKTLFELNSEADLDYLDQRIRDESFGDYGLDDIKSCQ